MKLRGTLLIAIVVSIAVACGSANEKPQAPAAAPSGASATPTATPTPQTVKLVYAVSGTGFSNGLPIIAKLKGFFKDEYLDVEILENGGGSVAAAALVKGDVQFASMNFSHVLEAVDKGISLKAFANTYAQFPSKITFRADYAKKMNVTKQSTVKEKIAALKGARVAVSSPGSGTDNFARDVLKFGGLDPAKDAEIVYAGGSDNAVAALRAGRIEAMVGPHPYDVRAEAAGYGIVLISASTGDIPQYANLPTGVQASSLDYMTKNPDVVKRVMRALYRAVQYVDKEPDAALAAFKEAYFPKDEPISLKLAFQDDLGPGTSRTFIMTEADARKMSTVIVGKDLKSPFATYFTPEFLLPVKP